MHHPQSIQRMYRDILLYFIILNSRSVQLLRPLLETRKDGRVKRKGYAVCAVISEARWHLPVALI